jgi:hypothetical protein
METKEQNKIELKYGFTKGFLPEGVTYKNYTMLVALANYSYNKSVASDCRRLVSDDVELKDKEQILRMCGGFLHKACTKTFADAWNHADSSNREALIKGLSNNEIEL